MGEFYVPGPPVPKARPRVINGRAYTPRRTTEYEQAVRLSYRGPTLEGPIELRVDFYLPNKRRVDLDNLIKSVADGLSGRAYLNDDQIVSIVARKFVDPDDPRTMGTVTTIKLVQQ